MVSDICDTIIGRTLGDFMAPVPGTTPAQLRANLHDLEVLTGCRSKLVEATGMMIDLLTTLKPLSFSRAGF